MLQGFTGKIVKWYPDRAFGFISPDQSGSDIYFRREAFESDPQFLVEGTKVQFNVVEYVSKQRGKSEKAAHVRPLPAGFVPPEIKITVSATAAPRPNINDALAKDEPQRDLKFE